VCGSGLARGVNDLCHEVYQIGRLPLQGQVVTCAEAGRIDHGIDQAFHRAGRGVNRAHSPHELIAIYGRSLLEAATEELGLRFDRGEGILEVVRRGLGDRLLDRLGAGALRDIGEHPDRSHDLPRVVGERTGGCQNRNHLAIDAAKLKFKCLGLATTVALKMLLGSWYVAGNNEVPQRRCRHARPGQTQEAGHAVVAIPGLPGSIQQSDALVSHLDDGAKARFATGQRDVGAISGAAEHRDERGHQHEHEQNGKVVRVEPETVDSG
jgi:hypothetical protein